MMDSFFEEEEKGGTLHSRSLSTFLETKTLTSRETALMTTTTTEEEEEEDT